MTAEKVSRGRRMVWLGLGERLRQQRRQRALGAKECARLLGVTPVYWHRLERGLAMPSAWQIRLICQAWEMSADELLALDQDEAMILNNSGGRARNSAPPSTSSAKKASIERTTT